MYILFLCIIQMTCTKWMYYGMMSVHLWANLIQNFDPYLSVDPCRQAHEM